MQNPHRITHNEYKINVLNIVFWNKGKSKTRANLKPRYSPDTKVGQTLKDAQKSQLQYLKWNFIAIYQAICWLRYCITWVEKGAGLKLMFLIKTQPYVYPVKENKC